MMNSPCVAAIARAEGGRERAIQHVVFQVFVLKVFCFFSVRAAPKCSETACCQLGTAFFRSLFFQCVSLSLKEDSRARSHNEKAPD
jgi:hypothetical protein